MKFIKKHIKLIIFVVVCIITFIIYNNYPDKKITYISLGDGFAEGINSYNDKSYGYTDFLSDYLKNESLLEDVYNEFVYPEMTIRDLYKDILLNAHDSKNNSIKQSLRESNLLTISVGINDLIYNMEVNKNLSESVKNKILTKIVDNYDLLIKEIKKYYQKDIIVIGYYNFYPQNSVEKVFLDEYNKKIKMYCNKNQIIFVDNNNLNKNLGRYLDNPNSFYPNYRGYEKIFNNILINI